MSVLGGGYVGRAVFSSPLPFISDSAQACWGRGLVRISLCYKHNRG